MDKTAGIITIGRKLNDGVSNRYTTDRNLFSYGADPPTNGEIIKYADKGSP